MNRKFNTRRGNNTFEKLSKNYLHCKIYLRYLFEITHYL